MTPWKFVHVTDMQPGSPRSFRYAPAWMDNWRTAMQQIRDIMPELILVGGDLTRDGAIHDFEFVQAKADLDTLSAPYFVIPGNMDTGNKHAPYDGARGRDDPALNVTGPQLTAFANHFGPVQWTTVQHDVRFTGFYAALAGTGLPQEAEMWALLESLADMPPTRHHVVMTHYPLFLDQPDEPTWDLRQTDEYLPWYFTIDRDHRQRMIRLLRASGMNVALSGHIHCYVVREFDGVTWIKAPATSAAQFGDHWPDSDSTLGFLEFTVDGDTISHRRIPLSRVSTAVGYGPGGHPPAAARDYSLAWEQ